MFICLTAGERQRFMARLSQKNRTKVTCVYKVLVGATWKYVERRDLKVA